MTAPHFPALTNAVEFAVYPLSQIEQWLPYTVPFDSGHVEIRARFDKPVKRWVWLASVIPTIDLDEVMAFIYERKGGSNYFYIDQNVIPVWSPYDAPTTSTTASDTRGARTVYVKIAYSDGTNTTNVSQEATQAVGANNLLTVTAPQFPTGVTETRIYTGAVSGTLTFAGTESSTGGTWTEPFALVNGDSNNGQKVLQVADTTDFESGQSVYIGEGTAREETKVIDTVQAGTSLTMTENLTYTHTAAQADEVYINDGTGTAAPTSNTLVGYEMKVRLLNEPNPQLIGAGVYALRLDLEQMF